MHDEIMTLTVNNFFICLNSFSRIKFNQYDQAVFQFKFKFRLNDKNFIHSSPRPFRSMP